MLKQNLHKVVIYKNKPRPAAKGRSQYTASKRCKKVNKCIQYNLLSFNLSICYFFLGPGRIPFVYISVCQFAQFVTTFYPWEAFCLANTSFAVLLLMFEQQV